MLNRMSNRKQVDSCLSLLCSADKAWYYLKFIFLPTIFKFSFNIIVF